MLAIQISSRWFLFIALGEGWLLSSLHMFLTSFPTRPFLERGIAHRTLLCASEHALEGIASHLRMCEGGRSIRGSCGPAARATPGLPWTCSSDESSGGRSFSRGAVLKPRSNSMFLCLCVLVGGLRNSRRLHACMEGRGTAPTLVETAARRAWSRGEFAFGRRAA